MNLKNIITCILLGVCMSFFIFPIGFAGLPESLNTKQMLAVLGVGFFAYNCYRNGKVSFPVKGVISAVLALIFSAWCYYSVVSNNGTDMSYARYYLSFAVWLGGGYAVVQFLKMKYGEVSIRHITFYLAAVGIVQCALALLINNIPTFQQFVDRFIIQDETPKLVERLYGIGASLDSAGVRYAVTLILMGYLMGTDRSLSENKFSRNLFTISFILLSVLGAAMARTTLIGAAIGLAYMAMTMTRTKGGEISVRQVRFIGAVVVIIALSATLATYLYNTNPAFRQDLRFAFEAFFNYFEEGEFRTSSTDRLNGEMWVWPTDDAGWIRGYGIFEPWSVFQTDIGYCRFVLYCGIIGMVLFAIYFIFNAYVVSEKFRNGRMLALMLLAITFIVWVKVSTDIFQFYALLFCIAGDALSDESEEDHDPEDIDDSSDL